ncbi:hypothetical protein HanRHA438_Chr00c03g0844851 [Helianthus annuus]|nr:hypothetical protein HanRHA438_Chr00c03g0844851 [Helianthus annuus]
MGSNKNPILTNDPNTTDKKSNPKLTLLPLIALIFYEVSGGPFGVEDSVRSGGGALLSLLGFLIFPFFGASQKPLLQLNSPQVSLKTAVMLSGFHQLLDLLGFSRRVLEMV